MPLLLGALPANLWVCFGLRGRRMLGGESALARAVHRRDGPAVSALLHHAPRMVLTDGPFKQRFQEEFATRQELVEWAGGKGRSMPFTCSRFCG